MRQETTSIARPEIVDPKERKRQRDRERYTRMSDEQKKEKIRRCNESRKRKKSEVIAKGGLLTSSYVLFILIIQGIMIMIFYLPSLFIMM